MKFYVYSETEVMTAFNGVTTYLKSIGEKYRLEDDISDVRPHWMSISVNAVAGLRISYPFGSPWNKKICEALHWLPHVPMEADYFIVPLTISYGEPWMERKYKLNFDDKFVSTLMHYLPYWQYNKDRHVIFVIGDSFDEVKSLAGGNVFRTSCHRDTEDKSLYYDVLIDTSNVSPIAGSTYECSFIGCLETHPLRRGLACAVGKIKGKTVFESTPNFFAFLPQETQDRMQKKWTDVLNDSEFILAPRGLGLTSIRFFETMAFGRIPVLIADDTKLPLEESVDYNDFIVRVPEVKLQDLALFIERFRDTHDLVKASERAREVWKTYFSGGKLRNYLEASLNNNKPKRYKVMI